MKSRSTLKQSGGADIKLKNKYLAVIKTAVACIFGVLICCGIYYFIDQVWNGMFVEWFMRELMIDKEIMYMEQSIIVREPNWWVIKELLLITLCTLIVIVILIVALVSHFYAKARAEKTVTKISQEIHDYMDQAEKPSDIFPREHAEVLAQISEIKSAMQRDKQILKEEASRKNDLITYLAHDLKTPLTSVIGYLSLLDEVPDMPQQQKAKYVNIALDKARRLEKLINEFFDITRYNLQQIELEEERLDLSYMLVQMADEFYPILKAHGNTIRVEAAEDLTVCGDSLKLARVFNNLLKNAVYYSYPNTEITIRAEQLAQAVRISFSNQGKTIPAQKLNAVFEKFFRLDEARSTNTGGAGLGLAIAKEIVTLHGGTISAKSECEQTTFCVMLPAEE